MKKYDLVATSAFQKAYRRLQKRGLNMSLLDAVLEKLMNGDTLGPAYRDHPLKGSKKGDRECHIFDDWLLEYRIVEKELILIAIMTGSHQDLFGD